MSSTPPSKGLKERAFEVLLEVAIHAVVRSMDAVALIRKTRRRHEARRKR